MLLIRGAQLADLSATKAQTSEMLHTVSLTALVTKASEVQWRAWRRGLDANCTDICWVRGNGMYIQQMHMQALPAACVSR